MAISFGSVRGRVQGHLRDLAGKNATFDVIEYDQAICDAYLYAQGMLPSASVLLTTGLTLSAGTDLFVLPSTVTQWTGGDGRAEYSGEVVIQLQSTREILYRLRREEMDARRSGQVTLQLGRPLEFCLWEEKDQTVRGRCYPGAQVAEPCDLFVTLAANDLRDFVGSGTQNMDVVKLQLSAKAVVGVVFLAAAELLIGMDPSEARKRKLNPAVAGLWRQQGKQMLYREAKRHGDMESVGRSERWVS